MIVGAGLIVVASLGWFSARKIDSDVALSVLAGLSFCAALLLSALHFGGLFCAVNSGACIDRSGRTVAEWLAFPLVYWTILFIVGFSSFGASAIWTLVERSERP